jgi:hypothetical protein
MPEVAPSRDEERYLDLADGIKNALHQHSIDNDLDVKTAICSKNLVTRKRGFLKLRYDPLAGTAGDIVVDVIEPSDIIIDKWAKFGEEPQRIYQRIQGSIEDLITAFPDKEKEILTAYGIQRGTVRQLSRRVTHYECWFTYSQDGMQKEGLIWFLEQPSLILGKMENPNFIYTGMDVKDREVNFYPYPIKPYIVFNYPTTNSGKSYIDETCLFDQAKPQQDLLNKRGRQIWENADYANGRLIANKEIMSESDAATFLNKNPKTIMLVDSDNVDRDVKIVSQTFMPNYVVDTLYDARNEIDQIMGTPNIFRGQQQDDAQTLGENVLIKEQASVLQDDLAKAIDKAMVVYYRKLFHMMRVYYTEDHWFRLRGDDGKYNFILLNEDTLDPGVKISVEVGSTLPANKTELRATAIELANMGKIDTLSLYKDLGLPDAEKRAEMLVKEQADLATYVQDVRQKLYNREANTDIYIVISGSQPMERDEYTAEYLQYINDFIISNKFARLAPEQKQALMQFLTEVQAKVSRTADLMGTQEPLPTEEEQIPPQEPIGPDGTPVQPPQNL